MTPGPPHSWGASGLDPWQGLLQPPGHPCIPRGSASGAPLILVPRSGYQDPRSKIWYGPIWELFAILVETLFYTMFQHHFPTRIFVQIMWTWGKHNMTLVKAMFLVGHVHAFCHAPNNPLYCPACLVCLLARAATLLPTPCWPKRGVNPRVLSRLTFGSLILGLVLLLIRSNWNIIAKATYFSPFSWMRSRVQLPQGFFQKTYFYHLLASHFKHASPHGSAAGASCEQQEAIRHAHRKTATKKRPRVENARQKTCPRFRPKDCPSGGRNFNILRVFISTLGLVLAQRLFLGGNIHDKKLLGSGFQPKSCPNGGYVISIFSRVSYPPVGPF